MIRDYERRDFEAVKNIHESTQIDYHLPNLNDPLFVITKVYEYDGVVRACGGLYLQVETYLWLDKSDWASPEDKLEALKAMQEVGFAEAALKGLKCAVLWLPPGMDRFGDRLVEDLGWTKDRNNWVSYSRELGAT